MASQETPAQIAARTGLPIREVIAEFNRQGAEVERAARNAVLTNAPTSETAQSIRDHQH